MTYDVGSHSPKLLPMYPMLLYTVREHSNIYRSTHTHPLSDKDRYICENVPVPSAPNATVTMNPLVCRTLSERVNACSEIVHNSPEMPLNWWVLANHFLQNTNILAPTPFSRLYITHRILQVFVHPVFYPHTVRPNLLYNGNKEFDLYQSPSLHLIVFHSAKP